MNKQKRSGFTLIELLLSASILGIVSSISLYLYTDYQSRNDVSSVVDTYIASLERARLLSQTGENDSTWGVKVSNGIMTIFQGSNYTSRNTQYDEVINFPSAITTTGITEFVFAKLSGLPQQIGSTSFTSSRNETITITINTQGVISR